MRSDEDTVSELVASALEHLDETGTHLELNEICRQHPLLREKVARVLRAAGRIEGLDFAGSGGLPRLGASLRGRYRLDARLGAGAMGAVYSATDVELNRPVAIKVLHQGIVASPTAADRFEREAEALAAIDHPSVVTIHERGVTEDEAPLFVMERVDGVPLSAVVEYSVTPEERVATTWLEAAFELEPLAEHSFLRQAVAWCADIASGLEVTHAGGLVHRDVKPSNIMLRRRGGVVLIDFGTVAKESAATLTHTGAAVGTPAYMAPEVLVSGSNESLQSDVYGLTATLFHLATGSAPFTGTPQQILSQLATRGPRLTIEERGAIPRDLRGILEKGMQRAPERRYESISALRSDLEAFLAHRPVSARPSTRLERSAYRAWRSWFVRGVVASALVVLGVLQWNHWADTRAARRAIEFGEVWCHVPANFGIVPYVNRVVQGAEHDAFILRTFDALVDADHQPVVAYALRASYHLDRGAVDRAVEDIRAAADAAGTEYAGALADAYGALPATAASAKALALDALPAPKSAEDMYLAGFHEMRQLRYGAAEPFLSDERLKGVRHAQELAALLLIREIPRVDVLAVDRAADRLFEASVAVEQGFGGRSAMTAHMASYALARQQRFEEALAVAEVGLQLCPASVETTINAARSAWRNVEYALAQEYVDASAGMLPHYPKAFETGLLIRLSMGEYDDARSWLDLMPYNEDLASDQRVKRSWAIEITTFEALDAFLSSEVARAQELASFGLSMFKKQGDSPAKVDRGHASLCESIVSGDTGALFDALVRRVIEEPLWPEKLNTLVRSIPAVPDERVVSGLKDVVSAVSSRLGRRWQAAVGSEAD